MGVLHIAVVAQKMPGTGTESLQVIISNQSHRKKIDHFVPGSILLTPPHSMTSTHWQMGMAFGKTSKERHQANRVDAPA